MFTKINPRICYEKKTCLTSGDKVDYSVYVYINKSSEMLRKENVSTFWG